jgi:hypothetical protein
MEDSMSYARNQIRRPALLGAPVVLIALVSFACTTAGTSSNANMSSNSNAAANANTGSAANTGAFEAKEPDSYSVSTSINIQPTGTSPQTNIPPLQFTFARNGTDKRVSFKLPDPVGEVVYLEKPTLKYLIFPSRNQYVELDPNELGFQLGTVMSPASIIEQLKTRAQYEQMGTDTLNGRTVIKYRFKGAADTRTKVGTAQADSIVYVDQETRLPLRSEIEVTSTNGAGARVVTSADNLQLAADPSLFEVPTSMKKVTSAELKQQVQSFANTVRVVAAYLRQQAQGATPTGGQQ